MSARPIQFYDDDPAHPAMTEEDRDYLLQAIHYMFPSVGVTADDVESSWAGVRPLIYEEGKNPSEISRKDEIWTSPSGLITIAGGKLTGYRKMAETVVDLVAKQLEKEEGKAFGPCRTKQLPISGGDVGGSHRLPAFIAEKAEEAVRYGLTKEAGARLARQYGTNVDRLFALSQQYDRSSGLTRETFIRLVYAIEEEMAAKPVDYFIRRTGALLFDIDSVRREKEEAMAFMARYLGWTGEERDVYEKELDKELRRAVLGEKDQD